MTPNGYRLRYAIESGTAEDKREAVQCLIRELGGWKDVCAMTEAEVALYLISLLMEHK